MQVFLKAGKRLWYRVRELRAARWWVDGGAAWDVLRRRLFPDGRLSAPGELLIREHARAQRLAVTECITSMHCTLAAGLLEGDGSR
jgi:hypothetical protein